MMIVAALLPRPSLWMRLARRIFSPRRMHEDCGTQIAERECGRLAELEQSGWKIRYLEYADALPSRLTLTFPGLELRLAIAEWK